MLQKPRKAVARVLASIGVLAIGAGALGIFGKEAAAVERPGLAPPPPAAERIVRSAFDAVRAMRDPEQRSRNLMYLAWGQFHRGEIEAAHATLRKAREATEAIPTDRGLIVPHPIVIVGEAQSKMGDREAAHATFLRAVKVLEAMPDGGRLGDWMNFFLIQLKAEGRIKSRETIEGYRRFLVRELARAPLFAGFRKFDLLGVQAHLDGFASAMRTVYESKDFNSPNREEHAKERRKALLAVVGALEDGDEQVAEPILLEAQRAIEADVHRNWAQDLEVIAKARVRMRQFREAIAMVQEMTNDPDPLSRAKPRDDVFNLADHNRFRKAIALVEIAEVQLKSKDRADALWTAEMAIAVVGNIQEDAQKPRPLSDAIDLFVHAGAFDRALRTARQIHNGAWKLGSLRAIARGQADTGDEAGVRATLREALKLAEGESRTDQAAEIEARLGDVAAALKTVDRLPAGENRQKALMGVAAVRASVGDAETALRLIQTIPPGELQGQAWIDAACSLRARRAK